MIVGLRAEFAGYSEFSGISARYTLDEPKALLDDYKGLLETEVLNG